MEREVYNRLLEWKNKTGTLILDGARQVGKTWILQEFGKNEYKNVVYINYDKVSEMKMISPKMVHRSTEPDIKISVDSPKNWRIHFLS